MTHATESRRAAAAVAAVLLAAAPLPAQTIAPAFAGAYTLSDLGAPTGFPGPFGGLTVQAGSPNTLLIGGGANGSSGAIYSVPVTRDGGNNVTGFGGAAAVFAAAPNIDGGLAYGPGGVLFYTAFGTNQLGQIKPGSTAPDKLIDLTSLGVAGSTGTVAFVPAGLPGGGQPRITSYTSGGFYTGSLTPDGTGTFDLGNVSLAATIGPGPEGLGYVPTGSAGFAAPSVLVSEFGEGRVSAYELDAEGVPVAASRRDFITGLSGAYGAYLDAASGNLLLSTYGGEVFVVQGFAPVPEPVGVLAAGGLALAAVTRLRRLQRPTAPLPTCPPPARDTPNQRSL